LLPQNCVVLCRRKRRLYQNALQGPFRPIRINNAIEIGGVKAKPKG
jgi:hypothetical protein